MSELLIVRNHVFTTIPSILNNNDLLNYVGNIDTIDNYPYYVLINIYKLQTILDQISYYFIMILCNSIPPNVPVQKNYEFLTKIKEVLKGWSTSDVRRFCERISEVSPYQQRDVILELDPTIPLDIASIIIEITKFDVDELTTFKIWIENCTINDLNLFAKFLMMDSNVLLDMKQVLTGQIEQIHQEPVFISDKKRGRSGDEPIKSNKKRRLDTGYNDFMINNDDLSFGMQLDDFSMVYQFDADDFLEPTYQNFENDFGSAHQFLPLIDMPDDITIRENMQIDLINPQTESVQITENLPEQNHTEHNPVNTVFSDTEINDGVMLKPFELRILHQPDHEVVYQTNMKPLPTLMLIDNGLTTPENLFVRCKLYKISTKEILSKGVTGQKMKRIHPGEFADFKLKLSCTSHQEDSEFILLFQLTRYENGKFIPFEGICVQSRPIYVISHKTYLENRRNTPPILRELIPSYGKYSGGYSIVLIGANFQKTDSLRVKINDYLLIPTFHESGALLITAPPGIYGTTVSISVSNDAVEFSNHSYFQYTY